MKLGTSNCAKYSTRNPKPNAKYVYHTGTSASSIARAGPSCEREQRRTRNLSSAPWISSRIQLLHEERATPRAPLREEARRQEILHWPSDQEEVQKEVPPGHPQSTCRDDKFRRNMIEIGRTKDFFRQMDDVADKDYTHHLIPQEICNYKIIGGFIRSQSGTDLISNKHCLRCGNCKKKKNKAIFHLGGVGDHDGLLLF